MFVTRVHDLPFCEWLVGIVQHFMPSLAPIDMLADFIPKLFWRLQRFFVRLFVRGTPVSVKIHNVICKDVVKTAIISLYSSPKIQLTTIKSLHETYNIGSYQE